jgi:RNA polymerase-interacting CarD/CdnL/TRCF family regulator
MSTIESSDMKFAVGDKVVHPQHGVGFVAGLEEKQFEPNAVRMYYVVLIPDTTLWVPVDLSTSGLRKLGLKSELEQCRQVLQAAPQALNAGRELLGNLSGRINQGTIVAQCEVVRDLTAFGWHKPLYGPLADFQRMALNVLCQEWAAVKRTTQVDASLEINGLLKKGRTATEH